MFSSNKRWWRLRAFSFIGRRTREPSHRPPTDGQVAIEGFEGIVKNITGNNYLTFTKEEIPVEGRGQNRALHVSVKCMDHIVAKVLVDNGSSLNVMPKSTLNKLPFNVPYLKPSSMIVWAFDGTRQNVVGEIDLPIQIGPHACQVTFQVMDQSGLQLSIGLAMDSLGWGGPFDSLSKAEVRGGGALGHRLEGRGYSSKLPFFYAIC